MSNKKAHPKRVIDPNKLPFEKPPDSAEYNLGFRDVRGSQHLSCEPRQDGGTPFCIAEGTGDWDVLLRSSAEYGNEAEVKKALQNGAGVDNRNEWTGMTALHLACLGNSTECVQEILYYGPNINLKCKNGNTPYMLAAYKNKIEAMALLKAFTKKGECMLERESKNTVSFRF
jgi:ankyrin repeat protein